MTGIWRSRPTLQVSLTFELVQKHSIKILLSPQVFMYTVTVIIADQNG